MSKPQVLDADKVKLIATVACSFDSKDGKSKWITFLQNADISPDSWIQLIPLLLHEETSISAIANRKLDSLAANYSDVRAGLLQYLLDNPDSSVETDIVLSAVTSYIDLGFYDSESLESGENSCIERLLTYLQGTELASVEKILHSIDRRPPESELFSCISSSLKKQSGDLWRLAITSEIEETDLERSWEIAIGIIENRSGNTAILVWCVRAMKIFLKQEAYLERGVGALISLFPERRSEKFCLEILMVSEPYVELESVTKMFIAAMDDKYPIDCRVYALRALGRLKRQPNVAEAIMHAAGLVSKPEELQSSLYRYLIDSSISDGLVYTALFSAMDTRVDAGKDARNIILHYLLNGADSTAELLRGKLLLYFNGTFSDYGLPFKQHVSWIFSQCVLNEKYAEDQEIIAALAQCDLVGAAEALGLLDPSRVLSALDAQHQ